MRPVAQPLLRAHAAGAVRDRLTVAGFPDVGTALESAARQRLGFLQACADEAAAVLSGDEDAATRLWLLLKEPVDSVPLHIPELDSEPWGPGDRDRAPRVINGDALLHLVAGVVRAARSPAESEQMLRNLGVVLRPLFLLERAASAAERHVQGAIHPLSTIGTRVRDAHRRVVASGAVDAMAPLSFRPVRPPIPEAWAGVERPEVHPEGWAEAAIVASEVDSWLTPWRCVDSVRRELHQLDRFGVPYTIESIENGASCVGSVVTLRGRNFGPTGRVNFSYPSAGDPLFDLGAEADDLFVGVEPISWSDTEIAVVVPPWATTGPIRLSAFTTTSEACTTIVVYRLGNSVPFLGGLAAVTALSVDGRPLQFNGAEIPNFVPGQPHVLRYQATDSPTARVQIELIGATANVLWSRSGLPGGNGDVVMTVNPSMSDPQKATLVVTASSACGSTVPRRIPSTVTVPPRLAIAYVEVTQGVQGTLSEVQAGRGMPTVANKDTAVRIYMTCDRGGWNGNKVDFVTGSLAVDGRTLAPTNARPGVPDQRYVGFYGTSDPEKTNETLNFTIPAAWATPGVHTLTVRVLCNDLSGLVQATSTTTWTWTAKRPLPVRVLYMGVGATNQQMLSYARQVLDFLPTSLTDIGIAAQVWHTHTHDLSVKEGWHDLLEDLEDLWDDAEEASGVRWLGIVPASQRHGGGTLGISGTPSIAVLASEDRPDSGAHELGHALGLNHVKLPTTGDSVPDEPYDDVDSGGNLRRPPFDVRLSQAVPLPAGDLMSYFNPVRPGITTWMRLYNNI